MINLMKKNKNFRIFWGASCISGIGDYVDDIAFAMLIYMVTESTLITSYVFAIKMILSFVGMFTSSIVDYSNKKNILVFTTFSQGMLLLILLVLYLSGNISTIILIAFVTIQTIFSTFSTPAQNALLPLLISDDEAIDARAATCMIQQFIQIFSYVGSGMVIASIGIPGAIIMDIVTFFISGFLLLWVKYADVITQSEKKIDFSKKIKEGFKFIFSSKIIIGVLFVTFLGNLFASPVDSLSVVYFSNFFADKYVYSVFMATIAVGGIFGTWLLTKLKTKMSMNMLLAIGFFVGGLGVSFMFFSNIIIFPIIAGLFYGISNGFVSIMNGVLLQINTPKEMMGRVFSAFRCITFASGPIGIISVGYLGEYFKLNRIFLVLGCLLIMTAIISMKYTFTAQNGRNENIK